MLPGLRFMAAALLLGTATIVFGLGALSLLRASHQHLAAAPTFRPPLGPIAAVTEPPPILAVLRVEEAPSLDESPRADAASPAASETSEDAPRPQIIAAVPEDAQASPALLPTSNGAGESLTELSVVDELPSPPALEDAAIELAVMKEFGAPSSPLLEAAPNPVAVAAVETSARVTPPAAKPAIRAPRKQVRKAVKKRRPAVRVVRRAPMQPSDPFATSFAQPARPQRSPF